MAIFQTIYRCGRSNIDNIFDVRPTDRKIKILLRTKIIKNGKNDSRRVSIWSNAKNQSIRTSWGIENALKGRNGRDVWVSYSRAR